MSEPPERPIHIVPHGVALTLVTAIAALCLVGQNAGRGVQMDADAFRKPVGSGPAAVGAIIAVIALNALFVAGETAVESLRNLHLKAKTDADEPRRAKLQQLVDARSKYVAACAIGNRFCRVALVFLSFLLAQGFAPALSQKLGWEFDFRAILLGALLVAIPIEIVNLTVGELLPKSFSALHPSRVGSALFGFIRTSGTVLSIFAAPVAALANLIAARFGGRAGFETPNQTEEEIKALVDSAEETGEIETDEKELLHSVFDFTDTVAREVMTPRVDLDSAPVSTRAVEIAGVMRATGHSRIPLYEETDDQIVGILHAKDLLMSMVDDPNVRVRSLMRPVLFVPEGKNLHELLTEMRQSKTQMAVVQDEFGGTAGIVTIEDIVEELVGEIVDEYDEELPEVVAEGEDVWSVDGKAHMDDVNHQIGSAIESDEFDTIGGYVFGHFGRQPALGEGIEIDGYRFEVTGTDGRRILRLKIRPIPPAVA
ncbi:hemolysin family protein [soil metagenome]